MMKDRGLKYSRYVYYLPELLKFQVKVEGENVSGVLQFHDNPV